MTLTTDMQQSGMSHPRLCTVLPSPAMNDLPTPCTSCISLKDDLKIQEIESSKKIEILEHSIETDNVALEEFTSLRNKCTTLNNQISTLEKEKADLTLKLKDNEKYIENSDEKMEILLENNDRMNTRISVIIGYRVAAMCEHAFSQTRHTITVYKHDHSI